MDKPHYEGDFTPRGNKNSGVAHDQKGKVVKTEVNFWRILLTGFYGAVMCFSYSMIHYFIYGQHVLGLTVGGFFLALGLGMLLEDEKRKGE